MMTGLFSLLGCRRYMSLSKTNEHYLFLLLSISTIACIYCALFRPPIGYIISTLVSGGYFIAGGVTLLKTRGIDQPIRHCLAFAVIFHGVFVLIRPLLFLPEIEAIISQVPKLNGFVITLYEQILICPILALLVILVMNEDSVRLLRIQAEYDYLTCLRNRGSFYTQLRKAANLSARLKTPLSLLTIDIDRFKKINDEHGHLAGDEALKLFARTAEQCVRDGDCIGRIGGEEFSIFLMNTSTVQAQKIAERLQKMLLESPVVFGNQKIFFTVSIGIASYDDTQTIETTIGDADSALYSAKRDGRNNIKIASPIAATTLQHIQTTLAPS